jgi:hypothetical protein
MTVKEVEKTCKNKAEILPYDFYFKDLIEINVLKKEIIFTLVLTKDHDDLLQSQAWLKVQRTKDQILYYNYQSTKKHMN